MAQIEKISLFKLTFETSYKLYILGSQFFIRESVNNETQQIIVYDVTKKTRLFIPFAESEKIIVVPVKPQTNEQAVKIMQLIDALYGI